MINDVIEDLIYEGELQRLRDVISYSGSAESLIDPWSGSTMAHLASIFDSHEILEYLLDEENMDINELDFNGSTCLHAIAISNSDRDTFEILIEHHISLNAKNNDGNSARQLALVSQHAVGDWIYDKNVEYVYGLSKTMLRTNVFVVQKILYYL